MNKDIQAFNADQEAGEPAAAGKLRPVLLAAEIDKRLPEAQSKIWHRHPVWFLDDNPTVGYSKLKAGIRLMSGAGRSMARDGFGT